MSALDRAIHDAFVLFGVVVTVLAAGFVFGYSAMLIFALLVGASWS